MITYTNTAINNNNIQIMRAMVKETFSFYLNKPFTTARMQTIIICFIRHQNTENRSILSNFKVISVNMGPSKINV